MTRIELCKVVLIRGHYLREGVQFIVLICGVVLLWRNRASCWENVLRSKPKVKVIRRSAHKRIHSRDRLRRLRYCVFLKELRLREGVRGCRLLYLDGTIEKINYVSLRHLRSFCYSAKNVKQILLNNGRFIRLTRRWWLTYRKSGKEIIKRTWLDCLNSLIFCRLHQIIIIGELTATHQRQSRLEWIIITFLCNFSLSLPRSVLIYRNHSAWCVYIFSLVKFLILFLLHHTLLYEFVLLECTHFRWIALLILLLRSCSLHLLIKWIRVLVSCGIIVVDICVELVVRWCSIWLLFDTPSG